MPARSAPLRLFLDAGVIIDGCFNRWGACKAVLILTTLQANFRVLLADPIMAEVRRAIGQRIVRLPDAEAVTVGASVEGWIRRVRVEPLPWPAQEEILAHQSLLSAVRHGNDMPSVVAAVLARPDWILSTNAEHWNQDLATRTGLRIATPRDFLAQLQPEAQAQ